MMSLYHQCISLVCAPLAPLAVTWYISSTVMQWSYVIIGVGDIACVAPLVFRRIALLQWHHGYITGGWAEIWICQLV